MAYPQTRNPEIAKDGARPVVFALQGTDEKLRCALIGLIACVGFRFVGFSTA